MGRIGRGDSKKYIRAEAGAHRGATSCITGQKRMEVCMMTPLVGKMKRRKTDESGLGKSVVGIFRKELRQVLIAAGQL